MDDISHILVAANLEDNSDESLNDLSWWKDGLDEIGKVTVDISEVKNPNNVKPELMYQWRGGPDFDFEDTSAGDVKRIPRKDEKNPKSVIHFARDLMNRGYRFSQVVSALKKRFAKVDLVSARKGLEKLAAADGLIGRVVLDARGYDSCKQAWASAQRSPWKSCIKYVVGCNCGDHMSFAEDDGVLSVTDGEIKTIDDHFVDGVKTASRKIERCATTRLRVADWDYEGFDDSATEKTFLKLSEMGYLPKEKADEILNNAGMSNLAKIREAFRYIDNIVDENENTKYKTDVSPEEYKIEVSTPEIVTKAVDGVEIEFDGATEPGFEGSDEIETEKPVAVHDDDIDMKEVEDEVDVCAPSSNDVEFNGVPDGDYEGMDEVDVEDAKPVQKEASVNIRMEVDFEL